MRPLGRTDTMPVTSDDTTRVVYLGRGSIFMFALVLIPFGAVAVFALRMAWVGLWLRDGIPAAAGIAAFAALIIWMIVK